MIEPALAASRGKVAGPNGAAAKFGIPRSTLDSKIKTVENPQAQIHNRTPLGCQRADENPTLPEFSRLNPRSNPVFSILYKRQGHCNTSS